MRTQVGYYGNTTADPAPHPAGLTGKTSGALAYPQIGFTQEVQLAEGLPTSPVRVPTTGYTDIASITINSGIWVLQANVAWDLNYGGTGTGYIHTVITDNSNVIVSNGGSAVGGGSNTTAVTYQSAFFQTLPIVVSGSTTFKIRARRFDLVGVAVSANTLAFSGASFTGYSSFSARIVG